MSNICVCRIVAKSPQRPRKHAGNTTFIIGIEEDRVEEALDIIKENCQSREQMTVPPVHIDSMLDSALTTPVPVRVGGATVFVLPVDSFFRF